MAVNATAVWRVRPSGSNTNGGGYDPGILDAGTDYSQQDSAQATGTHGGNSGTTFTDDTANAFTSAMVGNAICIGTAGFFFVVGYTSASTVTLDRSLGSLSGQTWHLGGGWADFWTNTTSSGPLVPGNIVYILGSGMPNPSSYAYDYHATTYFTPVAGSATAGLIRFIGDPNTPSGGVPCIRCDSELFFNCTYPYWQNLWFVSNGTTGSSNGILSNNTVAAAVAVTFDQFGYDMPLNSSGNYAISFINCEVSSSVSARSTNASYGVNCAAYGATLFGCNVHDCIGPGVYAQLMASISFSVIAKNGADGICVDVGSAADSYNMSIFNNTIDGNKGHGVEFDTQLILAQVSCFNNVISNHTQSGKYGMTVDAGTTAENDLIKGFIDYNTFYNNTTNYNSIGAGAHDTAAGSSPYVGESTDNWTLESAFYNSGITPSGPLPQNITGWNG